jgi:hypothetical protein
MFYIDKEKILKKKEKEMDQFTSYSTYIMTNKLRRKRVCYKKIFMIQKN